MLSLWGSRFGVDLGGEYKKLYLVNKSPRLVSLSLRTKPSSDGSRPALLNALVSLVPTLINMYTTEERHWFITIIVTVGMVASITACTMITGILGLHWIEQDWKEYCAMNPALCNKSRELEDTTST